MLGPTQRSATAPSLTSRGAVVRGSTYHPDGVAYQPFGGASSVPARATEAQEFSLWYGDLCKTFAIPPIAVRAALCMMKSLPSWHWGEFRRKLSAVACIRIAIKFVDDFAHSWYDHLLKLNTHTSAPSAIVWVREEFAVLRDLRWNVCPFFAWCMPPPPELPPPPPPGPRQQPLTATACRKTTRSSVQRTRGSTASQARRLGVSQPAKKSPPTAKRKAIVRVVNPQSLIPKRHHVEVH